jgi:hypothetical protein
VQAWSAALQHVPTMAGALTRHETPDPLQVKGRNSLIKAMSPVLSRIGLSGLVRAFMIEHGVDAASVCAALGARLPPVNGVRFSKPHYSAFAVRLFGKDVLEAEFSQVLLPRINDFIDYVFNMVWDEQVIMFSLLGQEIEKSVEAAEESLAGACPHGMVGADTLITALKQSAKAVLCL